MLLELAPEPMQLCPWPQLYDVSHLCLHGGADVLVRIVCVQFLVSTSWLQYTTTVGWVDMEADETTKQWPHPRILLSQSHDFAEPSTVPCRRVHRGIVTALKAKARRSMQMAWHPCTAQHAMATRQAVGLHAQTFSVVLYGNVIRCSPPTMDPNIL